MPITVEWENAANTIFRWTFEGYWTWDEFANAQAIFHSYLNDIDHKVDVIADMSHARTLPDDALSTFRLVENSIHPMRDRVVMVGANSFVRGMAATFNTIFRSCPTQFAFANTIDEACSLLLADRIPTQ